MGKTLWKESRMPLLPYKLKYVGIFLLLIGFVSGYLYFFGGKPDFFTSKIFAVITSYLETRYFVVAQTNLLDEIAAFGILTGLTLIAFSEEKTNHPEQKLLRLKALVYSSYFSMAIWLIFFMLIYGWTIFIFSSIIFPIYLLSYILIYQVLLMNHKNKVKNNQFGITKTIKQ